jgi:hypothetical protein
VPVASAQLLRDPDATLSAAGVADGRVVLLALASGFKRVRLRLSEGVERTVALEGAAGLTSVLRRFPYSEWLGWKLFWQPVPVLFYFREQRSIHLLPVLFDATTLREQLNQHLSHLP